MKKIILLITTALMLMIGLFACAPASPEPQEVKTLPEIKIEPDKPVYVEIVLKDFGTLKGELFIKNAPLSVENFYKLAQSGYYDGKKIHRVSPGFVLQGGSKNGDGMGASGTGTVKGEFSSNGADNPLKHVRGALSMARTNDPNSADAQFFIVLTDRPDLDGNYAAFGLITEGMEAADKVVETVKLNGETPTTDVIIEKVTVTQ